MKSMASVALVALAASASFSHASEAVEAEVAVDGGVVVTGDVESRVAPAEPQASPSHAGRKEQPPTESQPSARGPTTSSGSLVVLQNELEALETLVTLQGRKLETLAQMRASLIVDGDRSPDETLTGSRRHRTQHASPRELQDAVDRKLEAVAARVLAHASASQFDAYFIEKALVALDDDVVDLAMGSLKHAPTQVVVAVGFRSGDVRVLLPSGRELLRIETTMTSLVRVQLDTASDPPLLALLSDSPSSRLTLYALDFELKPEGDQTVELIKARELPVLVDSISHGAIRAIAIARSARRSVLGTAYNDGTLGFYATNGTLLHTVATQAREISTIATHRHVAAIAHGASVTVFPLTRQHAPQFQHCHGSLANVSSIAFDEVYSDVLYAGTTDGELLSFVLANDASRTCRLVHRAVVGRSQSLQLASIKGYVAATSQTKLVVFNVTRSNDGVKVAPTCSMQTVAEGFSSVGGRLAVAENSHATILSVLTTSSTGLPSLLILQSLLPNGDADSGELNLWRRGTILVMVVIAVVTAQFFLRRHKEPNHFDGFGDSKLREMLEKHGRESSVGQAAARSSRYASASPSSPASMRDRYMGDPTMYNATSDAFTSRSKGRSVDEDELRRKIAEARRETLECSFDDIVDDE